MKSYEKERANYKVEVPERFNPVADILEQWNAEDPQAPALLSIGADGELVAGQTVSALAAQSRRMACALLALGVGKGDRVLVMLPRVPAWYTAMLGAIRIGAVAIPTPNLSTARDIRYRGQASAAVAIVTDGQGAAKVDEVAAELPAVRHFVRWSDQPGVGSRWRNLDDLLQQAGDGETPADPTNRDDPMLIFFTSGTVSYPKMVLHPQSYALGHVATARFWHDLRPGDRHWTVSDTGWAKAAWGGLFGQWHERACVAQVALGKPDAGTILDIIGKHRITSFCAPPTLYRMLVQADLKAHDLSCLRHCTSAGEPLNPEVIRAWREGTGGLTVYDGYGQSETTALVANYRAMEVRPGSMGKPVPGYEVAIVDDDGDRVAPGEVSNIAVRTQPPPVGLFAGYLGDEEATRNAFRHGWYYTGDKGWIDDDGYFWFEGRADDVITSAAYRIGPFEVESALVEHPAVMEAAVVGKDNPERTQIVCAYVILAPGRKGSDELTHELQDYVKRVTAPYKYPREIHYVEELPKTISGKIRRSELRRQLRDGLE
ncbi:MAG: acyl-CoA synthetase [Candidatus Binataceae bacterium]